MMHDGMWGWHWAGMSLFWILPIVLLALLAVVFLRSTSWNNRKNESAMDVLEKRYAKGELTEKEFENMKKNISHA